MFMSLVKQGNLEEIEKKFGKSGREQAEKVGLTWCISELFIAFVFCSGVKEAISSFGTTRSQGTFAKLNQSYRAQKHNQNQCQEKG